MGWYAVVALVLAGCGVEDTGRGSGPDEPVVAGPASSPDADGDGAPAHVDCDDNDPNRHPAAPERCDGVDTDCDPSTREVRALVQTVADRAASGDTLVICGTVDEALELGAKELVIQGRDGGSLRGIQVRHARLTVRDLALIGSPGWSGWGLEVLGGHVLAEGVVIEGARFGGVYVSKGSGFETPEVELRDSVVRGHVASQGAGLRAIGAEVVLVRSRFEGNFSNEGGAIHLTESELRSSASDLVDNVGSGDGGGMFARQSSIRWEDGRIEANGCGGDGAGLYLEGSELDLVRGLVTGGRAGDPGDPVDRGGGIAATAGSVLRLEHSLVADNEGYNGAGLWLQDSSLSGAGTVVEGNIAVQVGGGLMASHSQLILSGWTVRDNEALDAGGGIAVEGGTLSGGGSTVVLANRAGSGAGLLADGAVWVTKVRDLTVAGNEALVRGGGVSALGRGPYPYDAITFGVELDRVEIRANEAPWGGGLYVNGRAVLQGGAVLRNRAEAGGGLHVEVGGRFRVDAADMGAGADDNDPDDAATEVGGPWSWDGVVSFQCEETCV